MYGISKDIRTSFYIELVVQSVNIDFLRLRIRTEHVTDATLLLEAVVETGNVATEAVRDRKSVV